LADTIPLGNGSQHRFSISCTKQFNLSTGDHLTQQRHILRIMFKQKIEQPSGKMNGKTEFRIAVQRMQEGFITTLVGIVNDLGKITNWLMGMYTEKQRYG